MPFVQRTAGIITGLFAKLQVGYAEEFLEDNNPEVIAFLNPIPAVPAPAIYASAKLMIAGDNIDGIGVASKFSGAFRFDVGQYWLFFAETQPDTNYIALAFDGGAFRCEVRPEDCFTDYLVITITDFAGAPADPTSISLMITRAN